MFLLSWVFNHSLVTFLIKSLNYLPGKPTRQIRVGLVEGGCLGRVNPLVNPIGLFIEFQLENFQFSQLSASPT